ncbi:Wadjet anti-phage system protein JetD domain-containing protein [Spirosoma panaciterrae]|uniref:Wadjet anti-phage system protein JetD domain-containing protein n=1 Tax=Spirosoma panaciterrae TaxID=496058 RepID=UPI0003A824F3|nr:Wadjet anti-phage system protein JetD domain-containing protein [Spirosoma panaciterrae]
MHRATFDAHRQLLSQGESTPVTELPYLTDEERNLFQQFDQNGWRVEQGRLGEEWVRERLPNGDHTRG